MTDITSALKKIQIEETKYGTSISEATATKIGGSVNYVIDNFSSIPLTESCIGGGNPRIFPTSGTYRYSVPFDMTIKGISIQLGVQVFGSGGSPLTATVNATNLLHGAVSRSTGTASVTAYYPGSGPALVGSSGHCYSSSLGNSSVNTASNISFTGDFIAYAGDTITIDVSHSNANDASDDISILYTRII